MKKTVMAFVMALSVMLFSISAFAANARSSYATVTSSLVISSTTATCTSKVAGTTIKSVTITQTLEKHWALGLFFGVSDAEWTTTKSGTSTFTNKKTNLEKGTYRVKSVFKITGTDGKSETITEYSDEKEVS